MGLVPRMAQAPQMTPSLSPYSMSANATPELLHSSNNTGSMPTSVANAAKARGSHPQSDSGPVVHRPYPMQPLPALMHLAAAVSGESWPVGGGATSEPSSELTNVVSMLSNPMYAAGFMECHRLISLGYLKPCGSAPMTSTQMVGKSDDGTAPTTQTQVSERLRLQRAKAPGGAAATAREHGEGAMVADLYVDAASDDDACSQVRTGATGVLFCFLKLICELLLVGKYTNYLFERGVLMQHMP